MEPRIGVTLAWDPDYAGYRLRKDYCTCIQAAGGVPLLVPDLPPSQAPQVLDGLDGLVLSGGGDYPPQFYGGCGYTPPTSRDTWEMALLRSAGDRGLPVLGICRGCQGLNIARGGDLIPDLGRTGRYAPHQQPAPRQQTSHWVTLTHPMLRRLYGAERIRVNSFHHQAIGRLAHNLTVAARAEDGVIEAVFAGPEPFAGGFALGVQWHPEAMEDRVPFQALVQAAQTYEKGGSPVA